MGLPRARKARCTYADDLGWPEDARYELTEGVACAMAGVPTCSLCQTSVAHFDVRLPRADEIDEAVATVAQPDVLVVCDPAKVDGRGVPDCLAEALFPTQVVREQMVKLAAYERAGVPEVWLLHLRPRAYHLPPGGQPLWPADHP